MRIIAGKFGGRTIKPPKGIRPAMEKVRGAIFNILGPAVEGADVLDIYAGSGALGIEALSRGAAGATFVDVSQDATTAIARNLETLGIAAAVKRRPAEDFIRSARYKYDLIFAAPPYKSFDQRIIELLSGKLLRGGYLVVEAPQRAEPLTEIPGLLMIDKRRYGATIVAFYQAT